jgi:preprotein translocase subunit SecA
VLEGEDLKNEILSMLEDTVDDYLDMFVGEGIDKSEWDVEGLIDWVNRVFLVDISRWAPKPENLPYHEIREKLLETLLDLYEQRETTMGSETMRKLERYVMLDRIDDHWVDHLYSMDYMEEGIHLRAYGQKDPLVEFKREAHEMFSDMIQKIREEVVEYMFKVQLVEETQEQQPPQRQRQRRRTAPRRRTAAPMAEPVAVNAPAYSGGRKVGRNDPCPCGSGKKYKKCCGR